MDPDIPVTLDRMGARVHPEDRAGFDEKLERATCEGGDVGFEFRLLMPDRSVKYLHLIAHGRQDKDCQLE